MNLDDDGRSARCYFTNVNSSSNATEDLSTEEKKERREESDRKIGERSLKLGSTILLLFDYTIEDIFAVETLPLSESVVPTSNPWNYGARRR